MILSTILAATKTFTRNKRRSQDLMNEIVEYIQDSCLASKNDVLDA